MHDSSVISQITTPNLFGFSTIIQSDPLSILLIGTHRLHEEGQHKHVSLS